MMKKLIVLVLALAIAAPALADDIEEWYAPFRNEPGSTYSHWSYDDGEGVYDYDLPDVSWFVSDPPAGDPCMDGGSFSAQVWGSSDNPDPCAPAWIESFLGRDGLVEFAFGSWDFNNFVREGAKDMWVQITYFNGSEVPTEFGFGSGYIGGDEAQGWSEYEGPTAAYPGLEYEETWNEPVDPCDPCGLQEAWGWWEAEVPLEEWDPCWPDPMDTWFGGWADGVRLNSQVVAGGFLHDVWLMELPVNPYYEWFEGGWMETGNVLIDQIVIETLCYVPEPATMVLLGLGSLLMIRRKRR